MQRLYSIFEATFRFTCVSILVFATVAFGERQLYQYLGLIGAYIFWIVLFIGLGSFSLHKIVRRVLTWKRFAIIYSVAFFMYSCAWMASYFTSPNTTGEWIGSFGGSVAIAFVFAMPFKMYKCLLMWISCFFLMHSLGYFSGSFLFESLKHSKNGMVLWGICYGAGTGIGLGYILYDIKQRLINK